MVQVCGTDGETYARVDYRGECEDDDEDEVVIDKCARLRRSNRCTAIASTCTSRILPEDGCCPVCGEESPPPFPFPTLPFSPSFLPLPLLPPVLVKSGLNFCLTHTNHTYLSPHRWSGAVTIDFDRDAFDEFIRLNPELETLDEFLRELVASGFIPEEIIRACTITANLLSTGSLHLLLENIIIRLRKYLQDVC